MTRIPLRDDDDIDVEPRRRRSDDESFLGVRWNIVFQVVGWFVAAFLTYNAITVRMSVVETRTEQLRDDVREIRNDVKALLRKQ